MQRMPASTRSFYCADNLPAGGPDSDGDVIGKVDILNSIEELNASARGRWNAFFLRLDPFHLLFVDNSCANGLSKVISLMRHPS